MSTSLKSYWYMPPRRVNLALLAPLLLVSIGFDLLPAEAQTSDPIADACTEEYPCGSEQGDCDSATECYLGLSCAADVGRGLGYMSHVDVCWIGPAGGYHSCGANYPCWAGMGDCDEDSHCRSGLHCVLDAGRPFGWEKDVGVCMPHQWAAMAAGDPLPTGAVPGGNENGRPLYVCRANHNGVHTGKLIFGSCYFGYGGRERIASVYEVMVYTGAVFLSQYGWVRTTNQVALPARAVRGGHERNGDSLYVCRATYREGVHPGKVVAGNCNISYGGAEIARADYEVLVLL